jgi:MFS family permease
MRDHDERQGDDDNQEDTDRLIDDTSPIACLASDDDKQEENLHGPDRRHSSPSSSFAPFAFGDFRLLYFINIFEFLATTLSRLASLQWLYETTHSGFALGLVGVVTLITQVPAIAAGGVLADEFDRKKVVSACQTVAAMTACLRFLLCTTDRLSPAVMYLTIGVLQILRRLEESARSSITGSILPKALLPQAMSISIVTTNLGEILAPIMFLFVSRSASLDRAFFLAFLSFVPCAVLPLLSRQKPGRKWVAIEGGRQPRRKAALHRCPTGFSACTKVYIILQPTRSCPVFTHWTGA